MPGTSRCRQAALSHARRGVRVWGAHAIWTAASAVVICVLQLIAWARTGTWKPIAILDALETAGASPRAHYSTASAVETPSRWSFESIIYWLSEFPLIVLLLIVAALLFLLLNVDRIIRKEPPRRVIEVAGRHK